MLPWPTSTGRRSLGDLTVEHGGVIHGAQLSWKTHGTLSPDRDNVVLYPTSFRAQHDEVEWLIGPDGVLDPHRWFVVVVDQFSNGLSSGAGDGPDHPALVTVGDNVRAQRRLLHEEFGVDRLAAVYGWSMGGMQAYEWASSFPDLVERAVVVCGSARTSTHNRVFLSGLLRILEAAPEHEGGGRFAAEPYAALRAFSHVYAGWARSQDFYREGSHLRSAPDLDAYLRTDWEPAFLRPGATNLYAQLRTWEAADISTGPGFGGDLVAALQAVRARVLLLPGRTDLYFRVADNAAELPHLAHAELRPIPSTWGHAAGNPVANPRDAAFLRSAVRDWLDR